MSEYKATSKGLFKDGKLVKLEYGHEEQIKAIRKYEKRKEALSGEGLLMEDINIEARVSFECICGCEVSADVDLDSNDMSLEAFEFERAVCYRCDTNYIFTLDEYGDLMTHISIIDKVEND